MSAKAAPTWTKSTPGQYGSNGINADGSLMNVGNKLGDRPSIKLFPQYNSGDTMRALLADCGGLGDGLGAGNASSSVGSRPAAIDFDENVAVAGPAAAVPPPPPQTTRDGQQNPPQPAYNTIKYRPATAVDQFQTTFEFGTGPASPAPSAGSATAAAASSLTSGQAGKQPAAMSAQEAQRLLWDAARQGNTPLVRQALAAGANALVPNPSDGWLALHYAAAGNRRLTCQVLLALPSAAEQCRTRSVAGETPASLCKSAAVGEMMRNAGRM